MNDLKRFLCMGGARPCKAGATAAEDTRASIPCEWCGKVFFQIYSFDPANTIAKHTHFFVCLFSLSFFLFLPRSPFEKKKW